MVFTKNHLHPLDDGMWREEIGKQEYYSSPNDIPSLRAARIHCRSNPPVWEPPGLLSLESLLIINRKGDHLVALEKIIMAFDE